MTNETIAASFRTRAEALAYRDGVRMLADLCPDRDIRVSGPWQHSDAGPWSIHVQALVATEGPFTAGIPHDSYR